MVAWVAPWICWDGHLGKEGILARRNPKGCRNGGVDRGIGGSTESGVSDVGRKR